MSLSLLCPNGHTWESNLSESTLSNPQSRACPICGAIVEVPSSPSPSQAGTLRYAESAIPGETVSLPAPAPRAQTPTVSVSAHATRDEATIAPAADTAAAAVPGASVPGYEILSELGRGGMGVVYKARQIKLGRLVALKMILGGGHAGEAQMQRFRTEAEAIARLQHPNIVHIYEVGEQDGVPFFSLEFCGGGSLEKRLAGTPLPLKEAAALVEQLASAMHTAHQKGIIHRDLKPANVLLTADGTPKITDFGLARKLDEQGMTQTGSIMGTPSYMAPEQAGGRIHEIGPACDVYALGAMLYEFLTGRPPFKAATPWDTIRQVVAEEPVSPRQVNARVPSDLETICLTCLHKEVGKRYGSAADLAEDLRHWQKGEPITARRIGRLERGWRWCCRNPLVAALAAAVLMVLVAGMLISSLFAVDASQQAEQARHERADAVAARDDLQLANDRIRQREQQLELTLARSLLRPLGLQEPPPRQIIAPLIDAEIEALRELAANRGERLGVRFVAEGVSRPAFARQLRKRAAFALHAAVGLDPDRRTEVEDLLVRRLNDPSLEEGQRWDVARIAAQLGDLTPSSARTTAAILLEAMSKSNDAGDLSLLMQDLPAVAPRLEAADAASLADRLVQIMKQTSNPAVLGPLGQALAAFPLPAGNRQRESATVILVQSMHANTTPLPLQPGQRPGLMPPPRMGGFGGLFQENPFSAKLKPVLQGLSELAPRLEARPAAQTADVLVDAMSKAIRSDALFPLADGLSALAPRLESGDVARLAALLLPLVRRSGNDAFAAQTLLRALSSLAPRLDAANAARTAEGIVQLMNKDTFPSPRIDRLRCLAVFTSRLDQDQAARLWNPALESYLDAMSTVAGPTAQQSLATLAQELRSLAPHLQSRQALRAATILIEALSKLSNTVNAQLFLPGLFAVGARLDAGDAASVVDAWIENQKRITRFDASVWLPEIIRLLGPRLDGNDAARIADEIFTIMSRNARPASLGFLAAALSQLASQRTIEQIGPAADLLLQTMSRNESLSILGMQASGLRALAPHLQARQAGRAWTVLIGQYRELAGKRVDPFLLDSLAGTLSALAPRLDAADASNAVDDVLETLSRNIPLNQDIPLNRPLPMNSLAWCLSKLAPRLGAKKAEQTAEILVQMMNRKTGVRHPGQTARIVSGLAARLDSQQAERLHRAILDSVIQTMRQSNNPFFVTSLVQDLLASVPRLQAQQSAAIADRHLQIMQKTSDAKALLALTRSVHLVGRQMDDASAAKVYATTVEVLSGALSKSTDTHALRVLAQAFSALPSGPEIQTQTRSWMVTANRLLQTLSKTMDASARETVLRALAVMLHRQEPTVRAGSVAYLTACPTSIASAWRFPVFLGAALKPLPGPLPPQALVDLLKQPLCTGAARRLVLDVLGGHYQRRFADLWDFVRFVREQQIDLDLAGPAQVADVSAVGPSSLLAR